MRVMARKLGGAALAMILLGVVLGLWPLTVDGVRCGSVFRGTDFSTTYDPANDTTGLVGGVVDAEQQACDAHRSSFRYAVGLAFIAAFVLLIAGASGRRRSDTSGDAD